MVLPRLSSKHGFSLSKPLMETESFQSRRGVNTCCSVSNRAPHRGPAWGASPRLFVPVYGCVSVRSARVSQINAVCLLPRLRSRSSTHTCLELYSPHLCWSSDITNEPTSICWRRRTPPRTSPRSHVRPDCALHLWDSLSSWSQILVPRLSLYCGKVPSRKQNQEHAIGALTPRTAAAAAAASCASLWRVILAIWQKQRGWCEECKRDGVERLPQQVCSVPPIRPLIGRGCSWGEEILPIGDNWCFVAGPSWPEQKPEIYRQQNCSSSLKRWHWIQFLKKRDLCSNILRNIKTLRQGKATHISMVNISHDLLLKNLILKLYNFFL